MPYSCLVSRRIEDGASTQLQPQLQPRDHDDDSNVCRETGFILRLDQNARPLQLLSFFLTCHCTNLQPTRSLTASKPASKKQAISQACHEPARLLATGYAADEPATAVNGANRNATASNRVRSACSATRKPNAISRTGRRVCYNPTAPRRQCCLVSRRRLRHSARRLWIIC